MLLDFLLSVIRSLPAAVSQGILWGLITLGVYISFRLLNMADMTVDGSFAAGGAVTAILITHGMNPLVSLFFVFVVGMITGLVTGLLHTKLNIPVILAGILSMIALYSVNIRIMGKANTSLIGMTTIMNYLQEKFALSPNVSSLAVGLVFCLLIVLIFYWFFGTELGSAIRATGNNENMVRALGVDTDTMKILGLMIANGMVALSGALVAQSQGYADVGMGTGTIVIGLASIIIGEVVRGRKTSFISYLVCVILGSVVYRIIIAIVLQLGLKSTDLKLFTAVIVAASLSVPVLKSKAQRHAVVNASKAKAGE